MKNWRRFIIPLLILAMLTSIPGIPIGVDLRGYPLLIHLGVGTVLSGLLALALLIPHRREGRLTAVAWLLISAGLMALVVPMLGWVSSEASHGWLEAHGWLSIGGLGLLGFSAANKQPAQH